MAKDGLVSLPTHFHKVQVESLQMLLNRVLCQQGDGPDMLLCTRKVGFLSGFDVVVEG